MTASRNWVELRQLRHPQSPLQRSSIYSHAAWRQAFACRHAAGYSAILDSVRKALSALLFLTFVAATLSFAETSSASPQVQAPATSQALASATPAPQVPSPLSVVVLDPAHGGSDPGARGPAPSGVVESEVVLNFARVTRIALEAQGFRVLLTREGNQGPSFDDRSTLINGIGDAVFISLHVSSTGPLGTVRAYSYVFPNPAPGDSASATSAPNAQLFPPVSGPRHPGLVEWNLAQEAFVTRSQKLAQLAQIQLAQKFQGSPDLPLEAPVRQLRTIAAPAIAIEVSSVAAPDAQKLAQMSQPLADAVTRAVVDYRSSLRAAAAVAGEER
jgi:N-acetylmuramoyl-L-alanine amidase